MTKTRILLADDHALLLGAFQRLLEPEYTVVGTVTDGRALVESALELKPDLIIVDIAMPRLSGLEAARQIKQSMPKVKLVFLTMNHDPEIAAEAFRVGASAFLVKTSAASELLHAIREVLRGGSYASPTISKGVLGNIFHQPKPKKPSHELTTRQREVVQLLAEGRSMKEVALVLNLTPRTVAFHKYRTMEQLNLKTFAELVQFAVHEGIVTCHTPDSGHHHRN
jgi:DNA-binding NarL/FixJ family response regulator